MKWKKPDTVRSLLILTLLTLACLVAFIGKAFHIDDPLFVWCARHIQSHPFNFYGFKVNWDGREAPMAAMMQNPPLAAYYMAAAGALVGWNESTLHGWFLLPPLALVAGTWFLARKLCAHPMVAALVTVTAPVFLLSSTSVMCDTMMMALWVWAVVFWMGGLGQDCPARLGAAAFLVAACGLTKYFGLSLLPLLLVYTLMEKRRAGIWLAWLGVPVLVMIFYQCWTSHLYGRGLLLDAAAYATGARVGGDLPERILTGLAFSGWCIFILLPMAPLLWGRKGLAGGILAFAMILVLLLIVKKVNQFRVCDEARVNWMFAVQFTCAVVAGGSLVVLAAADWFGRRTPGSMLLLLWISGTLLFDCAVNWTVSGRNILPMLPAASILLVRRLESRHGPDRPDIVGWLWVPLGLSLAVALSAAWADYRLAEAARDAAEAVMRKADVAPARMWFEGHWGFQYYMEQKGARPIDWDKLSMGRDDVVVLPLGNSFLVPLPPDAFKLWFTHEGGTLPWLAVMSPACGAGYYSDAWGPLPFVICRTPAEQYQVFRVH